MADNKNNGLITKIWGGSGWTFNHAVSFGYPLEPTTEQKESYKQFFTLLGHVLPCKFCRESYMEFISKGDTLLDDAVMTDRSTLTKWFYRMHEAVNNKLGVDYGVSYEDVAAKYESCRARCGTADTKMHGCVSPLDYKAYSYRKMNHYDCPIYPFDISVPFVRLGLARQIDRKFFSFYDRLSKTGGDLFNLKHTDDWDTRNTFCRNQIVKMRESSIKSIETDGEWAGTPTVDELMLLIHLSTNLNRSELADTIKSISSNPKYLGLITSVY